MTFELPIETLRNLYPYPDFEFESRVYARDKERRSVYRVLVLFLLSMGASDRMLDNLSSTLFDRFPRPEYLAASDNTGEIMEIIKPLGMQKRKLEYIKSAASYCIRSGRNTNQICSKITDKPSELWQIRGIGPKLRECVMAYGCGEPGLPVDSNVMRVIHRISGNDETEPNYKDYHSVRDELKATFKPVEWIDIHEILRLHVQAVCRKADPECEICPVLSCQFRKASFDKEMGISRARKKAKAIITNEWEPWRELICDPPQSG